MNFLKKALKNQAKKILEDRDERRARRAEENRAFKEAYTEEKKKQLVFKARSKAKEDVAKGSLLDQGAKFLKDELKKQKKKKKKKDGGIFSDDLKLRD